MYNPGDLISELGDGVLNAGSGTEGLTEIGAKEQKKCTPLPPKRVLTEPNKCKYISKMNI